MDADANAGIPTSSDDYIDTREGGFYWDLTQVALLEIARVRDLVTTDLPAAALVPYSWGDYLDAHAEVIGLERKPAVTASGEVTFSGTNGTVIAVGTQVGAVQTDPEIDPPTFATTESGTIAAGEVTLTVEASDAGVQGNVAAGAVTELLTPISGVTVTNDEAIVGGADAEVDEDLRERIMMEYQGRGPGVVNDYKRWALAYPGVGRATVVPVFNGPGTVQVIAMDADGGAVSGAIISGLQAQLDPVPGEGRGIAPIGAQVTVETPSVVNIDIVATVNHSGNYSLDGTGGTIATRASIEQALKDYIDKLEAGEDVIYNHVEAQFFKVPGVYDVSALTVEGAAADVAISSTPAQVARVGTVTLS